MKKRNVYKDVVLCVVASLLVVAAYRGVKSWQKEQKFYGFTVTAQSAWTQQDISEIKKLRGIRKFQPVDSISVTVELEGYTIDTDMKGICIEDYPLKWQKAEKSYSMGNTPLLFIGKDCFESFSDTNENKPGKSEIQAWMENYQELKVTVTDNTGCVKNARIAGILKSPGDSICMEQSQMKEIWGSNVQTKEGYMEVLGYQNMQHAKEVLMECGIY